MKKLTILLFVFLMMVGVASAATIERTISEGTVTLTLTGYEGTYGGIISETLPSGYTPTGITSQSLGVGGTASGKLTGQLFEIAFGSNINTAVITYGVTGSGGGEIQGTYELADNAGSGLITGESSLGENINGNKGLSTTMIILAIVGIVAFILFKK